MTAPVRVLVTGTGGPAGIAAMRSLQADESVELIAADMDPWAPGLYLAPARTLVPAGSAPDFISRPVPAHLDFCERAVIRFLDERYPDPGDIAKMGLDAESLT